MHVGKKKRIVRSFLTDLEIFSPGLSNCWFVSGFIGLIYPYTAI
jgi:hypothetical protein